MSRKRNNPSWCCDEIEQKIDEYKYKLNNLDKYGYYLEAKIAIRNELEAIIRDLEKILYE